MIRNKLLITIILTASLLCPACGNNEEVKTPVISATDIPNTPLMNASAGSNRNSGRMYGIGSVGKVFTAASVMKLVDQGKLDLDKPLTAYIRNFIMADKRYAMITPRMLLNHSSGLMGSTFKNAMLLGDNDTYSHDHFLDFLRGQTLKHNPGEISVYSNDSFTLAEILVERTSGISFTDFIEQNFLTPLGLQNIKTPQNDFDRSLLADIFWGSNELLPESYGVIGSGGIYATMEDLCGFAGVFMDSSDGTVLSRRSTDEMAKNHHRMEMVPSDSDTIIRYGLGWDAVDTYPFNRYGIKALSKGGDSFFYHSNLTVLPEYNLTAAVSASGLENHSQLVAQEIILAVLKEEGLIPKDSALVMPKLNLKPVKIPETLYSYAGIYDAGTLGWFSVEFTEERLMLTPIGVRNERTEEYIYNSDGEFVSTNGDYIGIFGRGANANGISTISFAENRYILARTYQDVPGLSQRAVAFPFAEKITPNPVPVSVFNTWKTRNNSEYLLVSEKHSSIQYLSAFVKTLADDRVPGYISGGIYKAGERGVSLKGARIIDEFTALGFQNIPTMAGRDINNISIVRQNGAEYLAVNENKYINADAAVEFSELRGKVVIGNETVWVNIGNSGGDKIKIVTPRMNQKHTGSWFVYDDKMNCIATSLEKNPRDTITLPGNGRIAFAGVAGAEFILR